MARPRPDLFTRRSGRFRRGTMDRSFASGYDGGEVDDRFIITFQDPGAVPGASTRSILPRYRVGMRASVRLCGRRATGVLLLGAKQVRLDGKGIASSTLFRQDKMRLSVRTRPVRRRQPLFRAPDQNSKCQRQRRHGDAPRGVIFRGVGTPSNRTRGFGLGARSLYPARCGSGLRLGRLERFLN